MATFTIQTPGGKKLTIDAPDEEKAIAGAQQWAAENEKPQKQDDIYTSTAKKEIADARAKGIPVTGDGLTRRVLQGATFNAADELIAGALTPFEMVKRGTFDPREGYKYAKAREDVEMEEARNNGGIAGSAAEIGGGIVSGTSLARGGLSLFSRLAPNSGMAARSGAAAADAAGYGVVAGGLEGNSLEERAKNAAIGGGIGALAGGATPAVLAVGGAALSPIVSNIKARTNPTGYARTQVARALNESDVPPSQVAADVGTAAAEGQPMFTVADALGNPGQRMLSSVTRAPGQGRTNAVEFLDQRQAGQGRRVAGALAEGFDAPVTGAQAETALTAARDTAADAAYAAARRNAGPVDLSNVVANIDATLQPGVNQIVTPQSGIANDSIEAALSGIRSRLTDGRSVLSDFTAIQRVRGDVSDAVNAAVRAGQGNRARLLGGVLRELDTAMESASPGFRQANREFAQGSRDIAAVGEGRTAAMRGRPEDTIPAFQGMPASQQAGFRTGYVDPLIEQAQVAPYGVNKARPLTSDAFRDEAAAMAPGDPLMQRRIGRENTMFETRNHATGNSRTADNLADQAALNVDPSVIANLLSGNFGGAARNVLTAASNGLTGNTPRVREEIANLLLMRGGNVTPQNLQSILDEAVQRIEMNRLIAGQLGRGAAGGLAVAPSASGRR